jgi:hypothetical protein
VKNLFYTKILLRMGLPPVSDRDHEVNFTSLTTDVMPKLVDREAGADVTDLLPQQWKAARNAA